MVHSAPTIRAQWNDDRSCALGNLQLMRHTRARFALPIAVLIAISLAACSSGGAASAPSAGTRTVAVPTTDQMRFEPSAFEFADGETVIFEVTNVGKVQHEFYVGTPEEQLAHEEEMKAGHSMHGHENSISVEPGKTGTLRLTFARAGSLEVGCHEIGHWDAGMRATITVR